MYSIGIDPAASKNQALAILDTKGKLCYIHTIKMGVNHRSNAVALTGLSDWIDTTIGSLTPYSALVESQEIYVGQAHKQKAIIKLANYSGMIAQCIAVAGNCKKVDYVLPKQWTNQDKAKNQFWICKRLGLTPVFHGSGVGRYCVPKEGILGETRVTVLCDVMDAIGIAFYLHDKTATKKRREDILNG